MNDEYRVSNWPTRLLASAIVLSIAFAGAEAITGAPGAVSQLEHATGQTSHMHAGASGSHRTTGQAGVSAETTGQPGCD